MEDPSDFLEKGKKIRLISVVSSYTSEPRLSANVKKIVSHSHVLERCFVQASLFCCGVILFLSSFLIDSSCFARRISIK